MIRVFVDVSDPEPAALERAADAIRRGLVVAFPTDTLYGLAANPFSAAAVGRVFEAKRRSMDHAIPLVAADIEQVASQLGDLPELGVELARRFWPGPLTLLIRAPEHLAAAVTGGTERVAVRVPAHRVARALCTAVGQVLTATSANVSAAPPFVDPQALWDSLGLEVDLLLDAGPTAGGPPSTIVDVTGAEPRLVRAGAVPWEELMEALKT